jgi:hypothetical protein
MTQALPAGKRRLITRYRVIVSVVLAAAAAALYVGVTQSVDHTTETERTTFVARVEPGPGETALRQARIVAVLQDGYTGVLIVDGLEIPEDQLDRREGLNIVAFTPGKGAEGGILEPGDRCATIVYWNTNSSREADARDYKWCWKVH